MGIIERKEREREQRRQQIILTAEKLFLKNGVGHTTMDQIASECESRRGTLYLYFKSKEELIRALLLHSISILGDMVMKSVDEASPVEKQLNDFASAYLGFFNNYRSHFVFLSKYFSTEDSHSAENISEGIAEKNEEIWRFTTKLFQTGIDSGYFKDDINPLELAMLFWSASNGVLMLIDHISNVHDGKLFCLNGSPDNTGLSRDSQQIDYKNLIVRLWDLLTYSIRKT